jgi:hypothetical protein
MIVVYPLAPAATPSQGGGGVEKGGGRPELHGTFTEQSEPQMCTGQVSPCPTPIPTQDFRGETACRTFVLSWDPALGFLSGDAWTISGLFPPQAATGMCHAGLAIHEAISCVFTPPPPPDQVGPGGQTTLGAAQIRQVIGLRSYHSMVVVLGLASELQPLVILHPSASVCFVGPGRGAQRGTFTEHQSRAPYQGHTHPDVQTVLRLVVLYPILQ